LWRSGWFDSSRVFCLSSFVVGCVVTRTVLVLNADWTPLRVVPWERAVSLLLEEKVSLVESYAGRFIRSASVGVPHPAVVVLRRYQSFRNRVRFNRANVLARDSYTCQYCGAKPVKSSGRPDLTELTLDHVVPRAQSTAGRIVLSDGRTVSVTCWENVVTACVPCNARKADRTPAEAKMPLRARPRIPSGLDLLWMALVQVNIPTEWRDWLPAGSPWRDYWTAELTE
jgi:5-methylcytosine-specific restriction endonuclease McrA